ncbi:hypothetical protein SAMN05216203_2593 [Marinobacter daqiaonensis]|uniref:LppC lipoprotein n=1 Tax=Marinobacter daqiaonensis TaxID=650891 RepID=A0A1I6J428_9GAMM|nr:penicillin-binding protein activator [Marinobacter daqiaonensis]SFR73230.1 hypothetical protein SAMN05216203_2593 [Marinobacter daqiaonensis]
MSCHLPNLRRLAAASILTALIASGCAPIGLQTESLRTAEEALSASQDLDPGLETQRFLLKAAANFQDNGQHDFARRILRSDTLADPVAELRAQYLLLSMGSAVALDDRDWAEDLARNLTPQQYQEYPEELLARVANLQISVYGLAGEHLKAAQLLMAIDPQLLEMDRQAINDRIWQALKQTSTSELEKAAASAVGFENQGWFELAATLRQPGLTLEEESRAIRNWQFNWIGHPGTQPLPSELALMTQVIEKRPERITLAIPLSGPLAAAGNMVREGFLAAYYASGERQGRSAESAGNKESPENAATDDNLNDGNEKRAVPVSPGPDNTQITIVDTHGRAFADIMPELLQTKPDLIIGPLGKEDVGRLAEQDQLPVPVLALNYAPEHNRASPRELFQFGLSAEDEARQIADRVSAEGLTQVLVVIPRGEWGDRIAEVLQKRLNEQEGVVLEMDRYFDTDNFRDVAADLLGINASRERAIELERTMGLNVEFEPRRRQDAEAIIMVAEPVIARQFKPLFSFYYAGDLPVFSPSIVYTGRPDPTRDRDLNGVFFTDLPWILDRDTKFRQQAYEQFDNLAGPLGRLFAMGADAWILSTRLPLMQKIPDTIVDGHTGELTLDDRGRIHRTQLWGVFREGVPVLVSEQDEDQDSVITFEPEQN